MGLGYWYATPKANRPVATNLIKLKRLPVNY